MAGRFYPFSQYTNDLARSVNGLTQVYPSRFITVWLEDDDIPSTILSLMDEAKEADQYVTGSSTEGPVVDYGQIRNTLCELMFGSAGGVGHLKGLDQFIDSETSPSVNDINFISYDAMSGYIYSDVFVHADSNQGKKSIVLQNLTGADHPEEPGSATSAETGDLELFDNPRESYRFNAVVLFYNLYQVDPTSSTADTRAIVKDMPMGIYVPDKSVEVYTNTTEGTGTTWSTRICSRFLASQADPDWRPDTTKPAEYATLSRVLSNFADVASYMDKIVHKEHNPDAVAVSPDSIKAYLEEFRQEHKVNVPYIKDGHWFVNGRDLGSMFAEVPVDEIQAAFKDYVDGLSEEELSKFKGPKGDKGDTGMTGPTGQTGDKGDPGIDGKDGVQFTPSVDEKTGMLTWTNNGGLANPLPANIKGPQGIQGKEGLQGPKGAYFTPSVDEETGILTWTNNDGLPNPLPVNIKGPEGPQGKEGPVGKTGPQGETGPQGKEGMQGETGPQGDKGDKGDAPKIDIDKEGYLTVDGIQRNTCRLVGPQGPPGKDGGDYVERPTYGYTVRALKKSGDIFNPSGQPDVDSWLGDLQPDGTPIPLEKQISADAKYPYIWEKLNGAYRCTAGFYQDIPTLITSQTRIVGINRSMRYGQIVIDTDISIQVAVKDNLPANTEPYGNGACNGTHVMSFERWTKLGSSNKCTLTTQEALQQIYDAIKSPDALFNWRTFADYCGSGAAYIPFTIKFANGIFVSECVRNLNVNTDNTLQQVELIGWLHVDAVPDTPMTDGFPSPWRQFNTGVSLCFCETDRNPDTTSRAYNESNWHAYRDTKKFKGSCMMLGEKSEYISSTTVTSAIDVENVNTNLDEGGGAIIDPIIP